MEYKGFQLDRFQERAIRAIERGHSVLVGAPTGAGKTLIAEYALERAIQQGRQVIYTAPIKALSNQKFRDFSAEYSEHIGIMTGDVTINPSAGCLIMTTEIFRNTIFENPRRLNGVDYVILDEFHYMNDVERGTVWEESIIFAPKHIGLICLSATVPNIQELASWIRRVRGCTLVVVEEYKRPVPLRHGFYLPRYGHCDLDDIKKLEKKAFGHEVRGIWEVHKFMRTPRAAKFVGKISENTSKELIDHVSQAGELPCLYFTFSRRECEEKANENAQRNLLNPEEKKRVVEEFSSICKKLEIEDSKEVSHLMRLASSGISYHHAGLLPTHKELVERLFSTGLIKLLFATETFSLGINMPARSVIFDGLKKFDGVRTTLMKPSEYHQMAGRAGRRGIDEEGAVYSIVDWPYVTASHIEGITKGNIEEIQSQFNLSYSTLLNLYSRLGKHLLTACENSFKNFQVAGRGTRQRVERRSGEGARRRDSVVYNSMVQQVRTRMSVLEYLGYIDGGKITKKGEFARKIFGYEMQISEIFWKGLLDDLDEDELNVVMTAVVYEDRKGTWNRNLARDVLRGVRKELQRAVWYAIEVEKALGVRELTRPLDFSIGSAALAWSQGCDFEALEEHTSVDPGDVVRTFRMAVQLLRQTARMLDKNSKLRGRLERAMEKFNRDVVDAEKQLRLGRET